jgi:hypothetical protein
MGVPKIIQVRPFYWNPWWRLGIHHRIPPKLPAPLLPCSRCVLHRGLAGASHLRLRPRSTVQFQWFFLVWLYNPMVLGCFLVVIEPKNGRGSQPVGEIISPPINCTKIPQVWPVICHIFQIWGDEHQLGNFIHLWCHGHQNSPHHIWGKHDNLNTMLPTFGKLDDITILHENDIQISDVPKYKPVIPFIATPRKIWKEVVKKTSRKSTAIQWGSEKSLKSMLPSQKSLKCHENPGGIFPGHASIASMSRRSAF